MKTDRKYKIGDTVVYDGVRGKVEYESDYNDEYGYGLSSILNPEISASVRESQLSDFSEETFDFDNEKEIIGQSEDNAAYIQHEIGGITDKYYRDGNH